MRLATVFGLLLAAAVGLMGTTAHAGHGRGHCGGGGWSGGYCGGGGWSGGYCYSPSYSSCYSPGWHGYSGWSGNSGWCSYYPTSSYCYPTSSYVYSSGGYGCGGYATPTHSHPTGYHTGDGYVRYRSVTTTPTIVSRPQPSSLTPVSLKVGANDASNLRWY